MYREFSQNAEVRNYAIWTNARVIKSTSLTL